MDLLVLQATTVGADGSAAGTDTSANQVRGKVQAVYLDYHGSAPVTTDVTLAAANTPTENILTITNNKTDAWYYPRKETVINDGTATYLRESVPYVIHDQLKLSVAQANALTDCVTAYVFFER